MEDFEDEFDIEVRGILLEHSDLPYVIHKRKNSKNYWMRFSIRGHGQQRYSLGTDDLKQARLIAEKKYQTALIKADNELLEGKSSFDYLADQYVAGLFVEAKEKPSRLSNARYAKRICERYLKPYFKRRTIASIGAPKVNVYIEWRKIFWTTGPGKDIEEIEYERGSRTLRRPVQRTQPSPNGSDHSFSGAQLNEMGEGFANELTN